MTLHRRRFVFLYLTITILLLLEAGHASAQFFKRSVNWMVYHSLADTVSPGRPSFRIYPTLAYAPETSLEIGFSTLFLFQAKEDSTNRLSEINAFTFATLESQYGIWLDNALYGHRDNWFILGRTRFQKFPLLYFGLGPDAPEEHPAIIDANYFIFRQRVLRKIGPNIFLGPEVDYQNLYRTTFATHANQPNIEIPPGTGGSANLGLGTALVYDNRHNVLNVRKGFFGEVGFLRYSNRLGSALDFTGINIDARYYKPVRKNNVLALQFIANFYTGEVPFNQMALMGGEVMMRGYYYGRYRDKNMLAAQAEYRWLPFGFSKRIGAAVFGGTAAVAPTLGSFQADHFRLAGGAGIRYLLFPKKDIFIRLDVGATKDGFGFYFFTGEAF
ncbi:MAG: BamA/TamA family outer membrane protein [Chitinophagaceae bacterium]|jgi:hypothetical protein